MKEKYVDSLVYLGIILLAVIIQWFVSGFFADQSWDKTGWDHLQMFYFLAGQSILYGMIIIVYTLLKKDTKQKIDTIVKE